MKQVGSLLRTRSAVHALLLVAGLMLGCSGDEKKSGARADALACTRDPALIAERWQCRADDHCPCGSHCVLGECAAECENDADCAGGYCDAFGRCRAEGESALVPAPPRSSAGELSVEPAFLALTTPDDPRPLSITALGRELDAVRVTVGSGLEVECPDGGGFGAECRLERVTPGERARVLVRPAAGADAEDSMEVRVFSGTHVASASAALRSAVRTLSLTGLTPGLYEGHAVASAGSIGVAPETLRLPIRAAVFDAGPSSAVLSLSDPFGAFGPGKAWIGTLTQSGSAVTVDLPDFVLHEGSAASGAATEIVAVARSSSGRATDDTLAFDVTTSYAGLTPGASPETHWSVVLSRTGDLPEDEQAPAVPGDAAPALELDRALDAWPWEARAAAGFGPYSALTEQEKLAVEALFRREGEQGWLGACRLDAADLADISLKAADRAWQTGELVSGAFNAASGNAVIDALASLRSYDVASGQNSVRFDAGSTRYRIASDVEMPCEVEFATASVPSYSQSACLVAPESIELELGTVDVCDRMAELYGCEPSPASGDFTLTLESLSLAVAYRTEESPDGGFCYAIATDETPVTGGVRRACKLPPAPPPCAELALCFDEPDQTSADGLLAPLLGTQVAAVSGDLECASGPRAALTALDENAARPLGDPERLSADAALEACAADVARIESQPPAAGATGGADLAELFGQGSCLDAARWLYALGLSSDAARRHAFDPTTYAATAESSALFQRLLQRWLEIHAFIAREGAARHRLDALLAGAQSGDLPPMRELLDRALHGFELLLHPRFAAALLALPTDVLRVPDYRPRLTGSTFEANPNHDQSAGLPVAMIEALGAAVELVAVELQAAARSGERPALQSLGKVLKTVHVVRATAAELVARAVSEAPSPSWLPRFQAAIAALDSSIERATALGVAIDAGKNPLGIEADDIPLYFLGDEQSAQSRFSAISDFFIGRGPMDRSWASTAVEAAEQAVEAAREAWLEERDRVLLAEQSANDAAERLDAVKRSYGDRLIELCGLPAGLDAYDYVERWQEATGHEFSGANCFYLESPPAGCPERDHPAYAEQDRSLTVEQVRYRLCVAGEVRKKAAGMGGFALPALNQLADADCKTLELEDCDGGRCVRCTTDSDVLVQPITAAALLAMNDAGIPGSVVESAHTACSARPGVDSSLFDHPGVVEWGKAECYRGSLGELALALQASVADLEIARSQYAEHLDAYGIAMSSCLRLQAGQEELEEALESHQETMSILRGVKLATDVVANSAAAVKECFAAASNQDAFKVVLSAGVSVGATGITCGAGALEAAMRNVSLGLELGMAEAQAAHEKLVLRVSNSTERERCFIEAEQHMVGARTARLQIERALRDVELSRYNLIENMSFAQDVYNEAVAKIAVSTGRTRRAPAFDPWLDEKVHSADREMRLAQRVLYLAVRAVEYESQQSLALGASVLAARTPADLRAVLQELWKTTGTRTVNGSRPTDLKVVVSLKSQLLALASQEEQPAGWQTLSDTERFRLLLQKQSHAVYDAGGAYLGQRIPFAISPLGTLDLGTSDGISILAGTDCAERLWSVNASIVGDGVYRGDAPSFTRIDLLKENTFYSQWCSAPADGPKFQVAAVRPGRNLFRDPVLGASVGAEVGKASELESRARIEAYFNVSREDFESDDYANGETSELAARGLYGNYALFVPAAVISRSGGSGLDLDRIDDILLRLDYVSVAR